MSQIQVGSHSSRISRDGATDCHVHVFGPQHRYPFVEPRRYTPPDATFEEYRRVAPSLGLRRVVLTQPSVHGLDNSAMLDAVATAPGSARAVVMVPADVDDGALERFHAAGARAVRTQLKPNGDKPLSLDELRTIGGRIAPLGWHVEVHVDVSWLDDVDLRFTDFPVPVVIEHMGHMKTTEGVDHPGFQSLVRLLRNGGWTKISGAYINSVKEAPHADVAPFVAELLEAAPRRVVWGSNWPHPHHDPVPDDRQLIELLVQWTAGDGSVLDDVLVRNPAELYGFAY